SFLSTYSRASKSLISPAMRTGSREVSKEEIAVMPERRLDRALQKSSGLRPMGVRTPIPVKTARRVLSAIFYLGATLAPGPVMLRPMRWPGARASCRRTCGRRFRAVRDHFGQSQEILHFPRKDKILVAKHLLGPGLIEVCEENLGFADFLFAGRDG